MISKTKEEIRQDKLVKSFMKNLNKKNKPQNSKRKKKIKFDSFRDKLYKNRTKSERMLSSALKKEGIEFKEQYLVKCWGSTYYLDFYIEALSGKWAVELDGYWHTTKEGRSRDMRRSRAMYRTHNIKTIRFFNPTKKKLEEVINRICELEPYWVE